MLPAKDKSIAAAEFVGAGRETEFRIEGNPGLVLVITAPGKVRPSGKVWRYYYSWTTEGRRTIRKVRLGLYGLEAPGIGLAKARIKAAEIAAAVENGADIVGDRKRLEAEKLRTCLTFADLVGDYIADHRRQRHASTSEVERCLRKDALPSLGKLRPSDVSPLDIQKAVDAVRDRVEAARGTKVRGEMARRVLRYIRQVFNHALLDSEELRLKYGLTTNPAESVGRNRRGKVGRYGKAKPRERYLTDDEILAFWRALDFSRTDVQTQLLLKLLLVTGARLSEVRKMDIAELSLDGDAPTWRLPARRAKNRHEHLKPLSPLAVSLLRAAKGQRKIGPLLPSSDSDDGFLTQRGARRAIDRFISSGRLKCSPFTPHDFRRTVGTGMARLGIPDDIIGRALGHKKSDVTNLHYIKGGYEVETREAMLKWNGHLQGLLGLSTETP
ncbi:MAG: tyrosine-type recombinase/integrase [Hyphomicrobiaceae bacterium]